MKIFSRFRINKNETTQEKNDIQKWAIRNKMETIKENELQKTVGRYSMKFSGLNIEGIKFKYSYIPNGVWLSGAPMLWNQGFTGKDVKVGVIDSGIDPVNDNFTNIKKRFSFVGDDKYEKLHSHGTHVSGTIAADGVLKGVAPKATLYDYRIFDIDGETNPSFLEKAIVMAVNDECDLINLSLGTSVPYLNVIFGALSAITKILQLKCLKERAVRYAEKKNVLLVVAAGNDGGEDVNERSIDYPAFYRSVLSVAAVEFRVDEGRVSIDETSFSNRNREVDVCADGYNVLSTVLENNFGIASGTSMACANVSGYAALLKEKANLVTKNTRYETTDLYTLTKISTVDVDLSHIHLKKNVVDIVTGAGLVTAYPEIPSKNPDNNEFILPNMNLLAPKLRL